MRYLCFIIILLFLTCLVIKCTDMLKKCVSIIIIIGIISCPYCSRLLWLTHYDGYVSYLQYIFIHSQFRQGFLRCLRFCLRLPEEDRSKSTFNKTSVRTAISVVSGYRIFKKNDDESRNGEEKDNPAFVLDTGNYVTVNDNDVTKQPDDVSLQQNEVEANI